MGPRAASASFSARCCRLLLQDARVLIILDENILNARRCRKGMANRSLRRADAGLAR